MTPSLWTRFKRWLTKFEPAFLPMADYVALRTRPPRQPPTNQNLSLTRRNLRELLRADPKLYKMLGERDCVLEVVVRETGLMVAVFPAYWSARDYSGDDSDLVFAHNTQSDARGNHRFLWTDDDGWIERGTYRGYDFHPLTPIQNPFVNPHHPLFIFTPKPKGK